MMTRAQEYLRHAADCVRVARQTTSPRDKAMLLDMAQKWRDLAEQPRGEAPDERSDG
jgi:hypothetical protein